MNRDADTSISVLFAEVADSVKLHDKLGRNEARWVIERCLKRMERAADAMGGKVIKAGNHELTATFPTADAAFHAAIDMRQRVADLPPISGVRLEIRLAFAFGPAQQSANELSGEAVKEAAWLLGMSSPGRILTSATTRHHLSPALMAATRIFECEGSNKSGKVIHEILNPGTVCTVSDEASVATVSAKALLPTMRLVLRHDGQHVVLDASRDYLSLGRAECDLILRGNKVSRVHARIELRGSSLFITDMSTNGTFVKIGTAPEVVLHREELILQGKGVIGLGTSTRDSDTDCLEFELLT